ETLYDTSDLALAVNEGNQFEASSESSFDTADDTLDFDFNDVDELVDSSSVAADSDDFSANSLDFDLTDDEEIAQTPTEVFAAPDSADELADLDFDLEDLDEGTSSQTDAEIRPSLADDSDGLGSIDFDMPGSESETFDDEKV